MIELLRPAYADADLVVLEGFHAVKHALRFGADLVAVYIADLEATIELAGELAPDIAEDLQARAVIVAPGDLRAAAPHVRTNVVGVAQRPRTGFASSMRQALGAPVVLLEDPRDPGNVGAVVRVAAAANVAGVATTGRLDPWDRAALRGSAGLHFALPVGQVGGLDAIVANRPVVGFDPGGERFDPRRLPPDAVLAFGTERAGLSAALAERCQALLALPMRPGVSSLNLATSVAAVLFSWRLTDAGPEPD